MGNSKYQQPSGTQRRVMDLLKTAVACSMSEIYNQYSYYSLKVLSYIKPHAESKAYCQQRGNSWILKSKNTAGWGPSDSCYATTSSYLNPIKLSFDEARPSMSSCIQGSTQAACCAKSMESGIECNIPPPPPH